MDAYSIGFVSGAVFGLVAGLVVVLVTCIVRVPKTGVVKIMDPEELRRRFEENEKHKMLRPFELTKVDQPAVIIEGADFVKLQAEIAKRREEKKS
ncbi:MAG: hypothetical protein G01um101419_335 [Parcubacteria group bacterium Gr01-1014_19]|nr:MAG: hypothetical protein G01um101419_335 [Parcubacteria group bacterium Gr01-1014_19]